MPVRPVPQWPTPARPRVVRGSNHSGDGGARQRDAHKVLEPLVDSQLFEPELSPALTPASARERTGHRSPTVRGFAFVSARYYGLPRRHDERSPDLRPLARGPAIDRAQHV